MDLKKTLLMPKTSFEMRGNLAQKEPIFVADWREGNLYAKMLENRLGCEEYQLHDGPPYANNSIHCGHTLNHILKDFVVRYKNMSGYYTPFVFGWDTHGLPIENQVTKSGINRKTTPINEFRNKCHDYALKQVNIQREQVRRLGVIGDYDHPYLTLDKEYEANQLNVFKTMALEGLIFKGLKPVYWSPSSESALAEAEIEYKNVDSHAIYVRFRVKDGGKILPNDAYFVIWTTTPWTLPANLAISVHPDFEYGLYETEKGKLIVLTSLLSSFMKETGIKKAQLIKVIKGKDMDGLVADHPLYHRDSLIINGEHVTDDAGTGQVHTAPGHGEDDFIVGQKYHLPILCPVDSRGFMTEEAGERLKGVFYENANDLVLAWLREEDALLADTIINHSYPHDWRTGKPLIFRATPQWFCSIDKIRDQLLKAVDEVKWNPEWGKTRMHNMIKDRGDWCISRQRAWGVPIPIIYAEDGTPLIDKDIFDNVIKLVRQYGSNVWFERSAEELLPEGYTNSHSPNGVYSKEKDIMDVWFDSGSSFSGVLLQRGMKFPADLYIEGSDQYRGWFNSSLIISVATTGVAPYKMVASHGFVMDENWEKMSKSKGNGIDPNKIANIYGADLLRLWAANVDYHADSRLSESIIQQMSESYRKIRNTFRFLLGNLPAVDDEKYIDAIQKFTPIEIVDKFLLSRLDALTNNVLEAYDNLDFASVTSALATFISADLSSFYLDFAKDILYCESKYSLRRLGVEHVLYAVSDRLMRLYEPILTFTMEEVYRAFPKTNKKFALQLEDMPKSQTLDQETLKQYELFLSFRESVLKALEEARKTGLIGSAQEALLEVGEKLVPPALLGIDKDELARLFIVSEVKFKGTGINVVRHLGTKCDRCWNYHDETVTLEDGTHLCHRCVEAIGEEHVD